MNPKASRLLRVIHTANLYLGLQSEAADTLMLATALHESQGLKYRKQVNGPALGLFQMEPATHDDIVNNFLAYRPELKSRVFDFLGYPGLDNLPKPRNLMLNDFYAAAMCRVHYLRAPEPLPHQDDIKDIANYWKAYYNSSKGKGTVEEFIKNVTEFIK